jgi:hypothetical protein
MVEKKKKTRSTSSSVDPATQYARDVDSGKEIAGPDIRNSCKRHLKDLESCHARGLVWDVAAAQRAIDFFAKVLKLNGGEHEGKPFNLLPWQCFIVGSIFGWKTQTIIAGTAWLTSSQVKVLANLHLQRVLLFTVWLPTKNLAQKSTQRRRKKTRP